MNQLLYRTLGREREGGQRDGDSEVCSEPKSKESGVDEGRSETGYALDQVSGAVGQVAQSGRCAGPGLLRHSKYGVPGVDPPGTRVSAAASHT